MTRQPALDFVDAVDGPIDTLRRTFPRWAPTMALLVGISLLPAIPSQFMAGSIVEDITSGAPPDPSMFLWLYLPIFLQVPILLVTHAAQWVCMHDALAGRPAGFWSSFRPLLEMRFFGVYLLCAVVGCVGQGSCCFGGFLLLVPMGLLLAVLVAERRGIQTIQRSVDLGLQPTGTGTFDRPGWKSVAVFAAYYVILLAATSVAQLPTLVMTMWGFYEGLVSGDPAAVMGLMTPAPWLVVLTLLVSGAARLFSDAYYIAGVLGIYTDAVRVEDGNDLEQALG